MLRHKLKSYCRSVLPTLRLFVQRHPSPTSSPTYHELDLHSSVKASLANHVVIEFPTVYVALPSEVSAYTLSTEEDKTAEEVNAEREEKAKAEGQE